MPGARMRPRCSDLAGSSATPSPGCPDARLRDPAGEEEDHPDERRDDRQDEEPLDDDDRKHDPEHDERREQEQQEDDAVGIPTCEAG